MSEGMDESSGADYVNLTTFELKGDKVHEQL